MSEKSSKIPAMRSPLMHPLNRRTVLSGLAALAATGAGTGFARAQESPMVEEPWTAGGLFGTFARPRNGPERGPAVLLLAGSGAIPRNGAYRELLLLAQGLAAAGIRSLRYDKRNVGASRHLMTREEDFVVQHLVEDAVTAARDLALRAEVSEVIMAGHSEGALLATLAAPKATPAAVALLAGAGRPLHVILREQFIAKTLPGQEHILEMELEILDALARGEGIPDLPPVGMLRPSIQPFLISVLSINPAAELSRLTLPTFIVQCARDIQVRQADFDALVSARPDAGKLVLPTANHMFKPAPEDLTDRKAQLASYKPENPLVPELVPGMVGFVRSVMA